MSAAGPFLTSARLAWRSGFATRLAVASSSHFPSHWSVNSRQSFLLSPSLRTFSTSLRVRDISQQGDSNTKGIPESFESIPSDASTIEGATDVLRDAADLSSALPPVQLGDFAMFGLTSSWWFPTGIIVQSFEYLNVFTGLPWFWTIFAGSAIWRLSIVPLTVRSMWYSTRLRMIAPQMNRIIQKAQAAKEKRDIVSLQAAATERAELMQKHGIKFGRMFLYSMPPMLLVSAGCFFALKRLCDLPVIQLTQSGFSYLPDLTVACPDWSLPILATALINAQMYLQFRDADRTQGQPLEKMIPFMHVLGTSALYWASTLPSGVVVYLIASSVIGILQSFCLRAPRIRRILDLPVQPHPPNPYKMILEKWFPSDPNSRVGAKRVEVIVQKKSRRK